MTEGTNTKDEKALYVSRVFAAMEGILGPLAPASYIVIHEVRGDSWGFQGQTQLVGWAKRSEAQRYLPVNAGLRKFSPAYAS